jgi:hypothetical protein
MAVETPAAEKVALVRSFDEVLLGIRQWFISVEIYYLCLHTVTVRQIHCDDNTTFSFNGWSVSGKRGISIEPVQNDIFQNMGSNFQTSGTFCPWARTSSSFSSLPECLLNLRCSSSARPPTDGLFLNSTWLFGCQCHRDVQFELHLKKRLRQSKCYLAIWELTDVFVKRRPDCLRVWGLLFISAHQH